MKSVTLLYNELEFLTAVVAPVVTPWCSTENLF